MGAGAGGVAGVAVVGAGGVAGAGAGGVAGAGTGSGAGGIAGVGVAVGLANGFLGRLPNKRCALFRVSAKLAALKG
ncbi:MAG: hypothetical protein QW463_07985 [Candidatus Caldarchaeum sp.]